MSPTITLEGLAAQAAATLDGGDMDCGSGLLLLLTRHMRRIHTGDRLLVRTEEPSVPPDLVEWTRLAGHSIVGEVTDSPDGPWHVLVERDGARAASSVFSAGAATPLGERLWIYSNFQCNLACDYCCAQSSPKANARIMPADLADEAVREFAALGGRDVFVTGGEPFLHPQIAELVSRVSATLPTTILTNAMVFQRGARRDALESMDRSRVRLQVSLDSADAALHDHHRGAGSHARAMGGITLARELGFVVRIAATLYDDDADEAGRLTALLDRWQISPQDRLIRPVARQGFADAGEEVTVDSLAPEPTLTVDGVWWHPVAVTDEAMLVASSPLPLDEALHTIADTVAVQDAARAEGRRHVFRCA